LKSTFIIACRGSWLSLAQAQLFITKATAQYPSYTFTLKIIETSGDKEQSKPLHLVEGQDFFTKEIQDCLKNNEADFAIHSMKDVSSIHFFKDGHFAIFDRAILQDVAIFNPTVINKIKNGAQIVIGTSSPRRSNMATNFLQKALPVLSSHTINVVAQSIRGNVDTRLQKLHDEQYDGIILAAAGLHRLLQYEPSAKKIGDLLKDKKLMLLPLFNCPPAAGQGAIVAETNSNNTQAIQILNAINNEQLLNAISKERVYATKYGYGCSQQFGVFHLDTPTISFTYAAGKNDTQNTFTEWDFKTTVDLNNKKLFASTDYMKNFFLYKNLDDVLPTSNLNTVFISSHKAIHSKKIIESLLSKNIWAAGTRTWYELAKMGLWVQGCADGLGFNFLKNIFTSPLININSNSVEIITNTSSKAHWIKDGIAAIGTYQLVNNISTEIQTNVADSDVIFWTSFQQYQLCKPFIKQEVLHACPAGKTATLLIAAGLQPIIFPTIKAFNYWRANN
jgi:hydroxymethylbilane synthase